MLVSELGSLTVTRPATVVVGAKGKLGAVSVEAGPPELGVGIRSPLDAKTGYPESEVGASEQTSTWYCGMERRLDAIIGALTRGSSSSTRDPEQLGGSSKAPERVRKQSTSRSPERRGEVEEGAPCLRR